jgi:hypothetical protein
MPLSTAWEDVRKWALTAVASGYRVDIGVAPEGVCRGTIGFAAEGISAAN